MLKHIPPLLTPELLYGLAAMGHGDELAVVDANFPAERVARQQQARLVRLPGVDSTEVLRAVLQLLPLDTFGPDCAWSMQVVDQPDAVPLPVREFRTELAAQGHGVAALERFAFYAQTAQASLIVQTGDLRKYANLLLRKGVIASD
jgi:L-fucose mutarotase